MLLATENPGPYIIKIKVPWCQKWSLTKISWQKTPRDIRCISVKCCELDVKIFGKGKKEAKEISIILSQRERERENKWHLKYGIRGSPSSNKTTWSGPGGAVIILNSSSKVGNGAFHLKSRRNNLKFLVQNWYINHI